EKAGAEVRGSHAILDNMRAVVAGAGAVLASAADWTAQIEALEARFRTASGKIEARIQRRKATLDLVVELCRLGRERDAADGAARAPIEAEQKAKLKDLRGLKGRYERRRDCR